MAGVLGRFFGGMQEAKTAVGVMQKLERNYRLTTTPQEITAGLHTLGPVTKNVDELAIWYLTYWVGRIDSDYPKAKDEVRKYLRVAKQAVKNGYVNRDCVDALGFVAERLHDIDPDDVEPGPP